MRIRFGSLLIPVAAAAFTTACSSVPAKVSSSAVRPQETKRPSLRKEIRAETRSLATGKPMPELKLATAKAEPESAGPLSAGEVKEASKGMSPSPASGVPRVATLADEPAPDPAEPGAGLTTLKSFESANVELSSAKETPLIFDIPVTYNDRVRSWIKYFQTEGRTSFRYWLERSSRYLPLISYELTQAGLPQDLVYVAMIESGFTPGAVSHAGAMGMWQFIVPTGRRYKLHIDWWIDERKDFDKSTRAAIRYMTDLYRQMNSWYLVAASYNMGENGVRRLIKRHQTNNFWDLADKGALPAETRDYVPKIIAAMLISKAPALYGFRDLEYQMPLSFEQVAVPGGTDLVNLAGYLGVSEKYLKELNPELIKGFIPRDVKAHKIRVPKGSTMTVARFVGSQRNQAEQ